MDAVELEELFEFQTANSKFIVINCEYASRKIRIRISLLKDPRIFQGSGGRMQSKHCGRRRRRRFEVGN